MATLEQVKLAVLCPLSSQFKPMFDPLSEPETYLEYEARYLDELASFEFSTLERGMKSVIGTWTSLTWPTVAFIAKHCIQIERDNRPLAKPLSLPIPTPVADTTPEEREVMGLKLRRLVKTLSSRRMTNDDEARAYCETGKLPEGFHDRPAPPPVTAKPQKPKPPPTARRLVSDARLQRQANAARADYLA